MSTANAATAIPDHVDPASVIDFDLFDDRRYAEQGDLHLALQKMVAEELPNGIAWTPHNGGHWIVTDHELLFQAARDPELFSSRTVIIPPMPAGLEPRAIPVGTDPPEHGPFRLPLMRGFAPGRIKALEGDIRAFVADLIERVAAKGECEFVDAIAEPLPVVTFMKLMGLELSRLHEFREWLFDMLAKDVDRRAQAHRKVHAMMAELIAARKAKREDDLISLLIDSEIEGRPVTDDELQAYCLVLFGAGLDTVANSIALAMNHLAGDPALQARLRAEPALIPDAVEEFLRKYAIANVVRTVTRDAEFAGVQLKAGELVVLMIPAGNYDPKAYARPGEFDLAREEAHITFNTGPHRCVGSHLARDELRIFLEEWFKRMPQVRRDPDRRPTLCAGQTLGVRALHICWDPEQVRAV